MVWRWYVVSSQAIHLVVCAKLAQCQPRSMPSAFVDSGDAHTHIHRDTHANRYANSDFNPNGYGYCNDHADTHRDSYAYDHPDTYSDAHRHL